MVRSEGCRVLPGAVSGSQKTNFIYAYILNLAGPKFQYLQRKSVYFFDVTQIETNFICIVIFKVMWVGE